ncbi:MAG: hypothetical protein K5917_06625 [Clostridiales bacterium]|nr:hypothetical protein [Clostridiales bacterium]
MFGLKLGSKYLVECAFKEEWIFMLIPLITLALFIFLDNIGKYVNLVWLVMWFVTQFLSHEWYTIFKSGFMGDMENKISYFQNCIQLFKIEGRYCPDLYHIILHILIVTAIICVALVPQKAKKR